MKEPWQVIVELQCEGSKLNKEWILEEQAKENNKNFFTGLRFALSKFITFGVKKIPSSDEAIEADRRANGSVDLLTWSEFESTCRLLMDRKLAGNEAKEWIWSMMLSCDPDAWDNWYRLILQKKLRAGITLKTVNKAVKGYPDFHIAVFDCQLAFDLDKYPHLFSGKKIVETKLDGIRCIAWIFRSGLVKLYSRNGKEFLNFPLVVEELSTISKYLTRDLVLDGEIMSASFQKLLSQFRRKHDIEVSDAVYHVFDWMPLDEFNFGRSYLKQFDRSVDLPRFIPEAKHYVVQTGWTVVELDNAEGTILFEELKQKALAGGFEGVMLKDPEALYECKRVNSWLKMKPFIELTLVIKAVEEGKEESEAAGMMGALLCEGYYEDEFISVSVGSGFSAEQRFDYWSSKDQLLGILAEIRADSVTKNKEGGASLRFPRFKGLRGFIEGEQL